MERIVRCGRRYDRLTAEPFRFLANCEPGLCLDVGAAIGTMVRFMLRESPLSRVIAYEPFAGNKPHLQRAWGGDRRVTIRPVAVGARAGNMRFSVPRLVNDQLPGWAAFPGASTVGYLSRRGGSRVPVVRLDDEIDEHVRFLKIDVQGGELGVLRGARRLIDRHGIDLIFVEFAGDPRVLDFLARHGYVIFDCHYLGWPTRRYFRNWFRRRRDYVVPRWADFNRDRLSTGQIAYDFRPPVPFRSFIPYCVWFFLTRLFIIGMQTDLFCVHRDFLETFEQAVRGQTPPEHSR